MNVSLMFGLFHESTSSLHALRERKMARIEYGDLYCRAIDFLLLQHTPYDANIVKKVGLIREHLLEPGNKLEDRSHIFEWLNCLVTTYVGKYLEREFKLYHNQVRMSQVLRASMSDFSFL